MSRGKFGRGDSKSETCREHFGVRLCECVCASVRACVCVHAIVQPFIACLGHIVSFVTQTGHIFKDEPYLTHTHTRMHTEVCVRWLQKRVCAHAHNKPYY